MIIRIYLGIFYFRSIILFDWKIFYDYLEQSESQNFRGGGVDFGSEFVF